MCPTQRGPRDWPNCAIRAEATFDLEELNRLLGEGAEVAVDLESRRTCGERGAVVSTCMQRPGEPSYRRRR
jgi:hypothetical protein